MTIAGRRREGGWMWAACAVALATAVGTPGQGTAEESRAIRQIEKYCTASWRNARVRREDWDDCTQQALLELLSVMPAAEFTTAIEQPESEARRELNRAIWRLVQRCRRQPKAVSYRDALAAADERQTRAEWPEIDVTALQSLTPRQLQVLELTRDGWKVAEIAAALHTSPARVSDEKYKAIAKLRQWAERGEAASA